MPPGSAIGMPLGARGEVHRPGNKLRQTDARRTDRRTAGTRRTARDGPCRPRRRSRPCRRSLDRIVVARLPARPPCRLVAHGAGEQHLAVGQHVARSRTSASGRSVNRKGTEVSGQTISFGLAVPRLRRLRRQLQQRWRRCGRARASSHFSTRSIAGWTMRTSSDRVRRASGSGKPIIAEADMRRRPGRSEQRRQPSAQVAAAGQQAPAARRRRRRARSCRSMPTTRHALHQQRHRHRAHSRSAFQGKPVNRKPRSHSASAEAEGERRDAADVVCSRRAARRAVAKP